MRSYLKLILSMLIWGSLALFVAPLPYSSAEIVLWRIVLGFLSLTLIFIMGKRRLHRDPPKKYGLRLLLTGVVMGLNWMALFEAYRYVDISIATLAYYCAPIFVMLGSVLLYHEKFTPAKLAGMAAAVAGMIIVTGAQLGGSDPLRGILLGLLSASLYACVTLSNKGVQGLSGLEITITQLLGAFLVVCPWVLLTHTGSWNFPGGIDLLRLLTLGLIHTGLALFLYFSSIQELSAQTVALCSYIDPAFALLFAALFLHESLTPKQLIGAVLILGGALLGELPGKHSRKGTV